MSREERLSAYIDGELPPAEAEAFEREVEQDPELARELEHLLAGDSLLRAAVEDDIADEVPPEMIERFGLADPETVKRAPLPANDPGPPLRRWWLPAGAAIAASIAALMLLLPTAPKAPWQSQGFSNALDSTPSLQMASLDSNASVVPRLTFQAADGRYCREFEVRSSKVAWNRDGIACRSNGVWQPEALTPAAPSGPQQTGSIELAGGGDNPALDKAYDRLGGSLPLGADDETRLIEQRWSAGSK